MKVRAVPPVVVGMVLLASLAWAQFGRGGNAGINARMARPDSFDGRFHYCRAAYRVNPAGDGGGLAHRLPARRHRLLDTYFRVDEGSVSFDAARRPNHLIVRLTDDELFQCPFIMMQEVGTLFFSDVDATRLRTYLLKGGFLWVDDFWGSYAWDVWATQIRKVLPPSEFPIIDLEPDHPIFHTMFDLQGVPQIPSINFWYGSGATSERGADSADVHARRIATTKVASWS